MRQITSAAFFFGENMAKEIWVGLDLYAYLFKENTNGTVEGLSDPDDFDPSSDTPFIDWCFWQRINVSMAMELKRKPSTGKKVKTITRDNFVYSSNVTNFMMNSKEFNTGLNAKLHRDNKFRIILMHYPMSSSTEEGMVKCILKNSVIANISISSEENGNVIGNMTIQHEDIEVK